MSGYLHYTGVRFKNQSEALKKLNVHKEEFNKLIESGVLTPLKEIEARQAKAEKEQRENFIKSFQVEEEKPKQKAKAK